MEIQLFPSKQDGDWITLNLVSELCTYSEQGQIWARAQRAQDFFSSQTSLNRQSGTPYLPECFLMVMAMSLLTLRGTASCHHHSIASCNSKGEGDLVNSVWLLASGSKHLSYLSQSLSLV